MTLKTLGMGIAKMATKAAKKGAGSVKQGFIAPKTMKPFYTMVGGVVAGRQVYKKITGQPSDWEDIKEGFKKKRKEKKKKKDKE